MSETKLSTKVIALIASGASALVIGSQFLDEKEGNKLDAYRDGKGIWTICRGVTKDVHQGMHLTQSECDQRNAAALIVADKQLRQLAPDVQLSEAQRAGIVSFCTYNLGPGRCKESTFLKMLNEGRGPEACKQILLWVHDGGRDCRTDPSCSGQVIRRGQEYDLCMQK